MTLKFFFASSCLASLLLCSVVAQNTNEKEFNNIVASIIQDGDEAYGKDGDNKPFDYTKVKEQVVLQRILHFTNTKRILVDA